MLVVKTDLAALKFLTLSYILQKRKKRGEQVSRGEGPLGGSRSSLLGLNPRVNVSEPSSSHPLSFSSLGLSATLVRKEKVLVFFLIVQSS